MTGSNKRINNIQLKEAENNTEKAILGHIAQEAERIGYGSINIEVKVHNGRVTHLTLIPSKKTISLHNLQG